MPGVSVSGTGDASNSNATSGITVAPDGTGNGGAVVVAGNNASAYGGLVAISLIGDARGGRVLNLAGGCGC